MNITHDFHVHTVISSCGKESATVENYMRIAKEKGLTKIGFADHMWDSAIEGASRWYAPQNYEHVAQIKSEIEKYKDSGVKIYFGCEGEYDYPHRGVAMTEETAEKFDFILIPHSHTHITMPKDYYEPYQKCIDFMVQAYEDIINSNVSRYITSMAHPFMACKSPYDNRILMPLIPDDTYRRLFSKTAEKGIALEIQTPCFARDLEPDAVAGQHTLIRIYSMAKEEGCKFTFGSDAHNTLEYPHIEIANEVADLLSLKEDDLAPIVR